MIQILQPIIPELILGGLKLNEHSYPSSNDEAIHSGNDLIYHLCFMSGYLIHFG